MTSNSSISSFKHAERFDIYTTYESQDAETLPWAKNTKAEVYSGKEN